MENENNVNNVNNVNNTIQTTPVDQVVVNGPVLILTVFPFISASKEAFIFNGTQRNVSKKIIVI